MSNIGSGQRASRKRRNQGSPSQAILSTASPTAQPPVPVAGARTDKVLAQQLAGLTTSIGQLGVGMARKAGRDAAASERAADKAERAADKAEREAEAIKSQERGEAVLQAREDMLEIYDQIDRGEIQVEEDEGVLDTARRVAEGRGQRFQAAHAQEAYKQEIILRSGAPLLQQSAERRREAILGNRQAAAAVVSTGGGLREEAEKLASLNGTSAAEETAFLLGKRGQELVAIGIDAQSDFEQFTSEFRDDFPTEITQFERAFEQSVTAQQNAVWTSNANEVRSQVNELQDLGLYNKAEEYLRKHKDSLRPDTYDRLLQQNRDRRDRMTQEGRKKTLVNWGLKKQDMVDKAVGFDEAYADIQEFANANPDLELNAGDEMREFVENTLRSAVMGQNPARAEEAAQWGQEAFPDRTDWHRRLEASAAEADTMRRKREELRREGIEQDWAAQQTAEIATVLMGSTYKTDDAGNPVMDSDGSLVVEQVDDPNGRLISFLEGDEEVTVGDHTFKVGRAERIAIVQDAHSQQMRNSTQMVADALVGQGLDRETASRRADLLTLPARMSSLSRAAANGVNLRDERFMRAKAAIGDLERAGFLEAEERDKLIESALHDFEFLYEAEKAGQAGGAFWSVYGMPRGNIAEDPFYLARTLIDRNIEPEARGALDRALKVIKVPEDSRPVYDISRLDRSVQNKISKALFGKNYSWSTRQIANHAQVYEQLEQSAGILRMTGIDTDQAALLEAATRMSNGGLVYDKTFIVQSGSVTPENMNGPHLDAIKAIAAQGSRGAYEADELSFQPDPNGMHYSLYDQRGEPFEFEGRGVRFTAFELDAFHKRLAGLESWKGVVDGWNSRHPGLMKNRQEQVRERFEKNVWQGAFERNSFGQLTPAGRAAMDAAIDAAYRDGFTPIPRPQWTEAPPTGNKFLDMLYDEYRKDEAAAGEFLFRDSELGGPGWLGGLKVWRSIDRSTKAGSGTDFGGVELNPAGTGFIR